VTSDLSVVLDDDHDADKTEGRAASNKMRIIHTIQTVSIIIISKSAT
jgi:hypothetical protein